jgi:high-affinity Fe2+/Pb2+ permease
MASVDFTSKQMAVSFPRSWSIGVTLALLLAASPLFAQEAVETTKPEASPEQSASPKAKDKNPDQSKPGKSLEETMRPEEFNAAGLNKLSEDELQHLDAYLQGYRAAAKRKAAEQAQAEAQDEIKKANAKTEEAQKATEEAKRDAANAKSKLDGLVSRVDGNIDGIKGSTMIRLEDGTVWKQANRDDHFRATVTDHPTAVVLRTSFGYKMRIEGMPEFYVDPVVRPQ